LISFSIVLLKNKRMSESSPQSERQSWYTCFRPRRFQFLLGIILAQSLISPVLGQSVAARVFGAIVSSLSMVLTCMSIVSRRRVLLTAGLLTYAFSAFASFVTMTDYAPFNGIVCQAISRIIGMFFYLVAAVLIFRDVFRAGDVDVNKLCGSVCIYLLIGVLFGQFYQLCDIVDPGCFVFEMEKLVRHGSLSYFERSHLFNYFSFVTLSTLGYGDISPVTRMTRTLSYTEAILGQLYLAVLVSRLVGLHIAASIPPADSNDEPPEVSGGE
jgi:voltage-gated potassium channel